MTDPQKDEHIEELLSKLQGIFGKLSHSEEEEAKQSIEVPLPAPKDTQKMQDPPPPPAVPPPAQVSPEPPPSKSSAGSGTSPSTGNYESIVPLGDPEKLLVPTAVYFPAGKEVEAKSLAQKLEMMTPKFTKVAFRLRVIVFMSYDPKSDWKDSLAANAAQTHIQTVFVVGERPMEDTKKKGVAAELEGNNIYFQDVPLASIEKKAFYTDILLGLVFFFDSHKPPTNTEGTTP